jgi:hypothetical protein
MTKKHNKRRIVAGMSNALAVALALGIGATTAHAQGFSAETQEALAAGMNHPFVSNAKLGYVFRTAYFQRDNTGDDNKAGKFLAEGMGIGGWLYGTTGEIADILSFGATYNFTIPLYAPDDTTAGTAVLKYPNQESTVSVMGEAYAKLRFGNHQGVFGRQEINNVWYMQDVVRFYNTVDGGMVGRYDIRGMQPIHFEAATVKGRVLDDSLRYFGGYIWNVRGNADDVFGSPGHYLGKKDTDGGAYVGLQYKPTKDSMIEGHYYTFADLLDMGYAQGEYVFRMENKTYLRFAAQGFWQGGNGDNLLTGGKDFSTNAFALYAEASLIPQVTPYFTVGWTDKEQQIRYPFAIGPHFATHRYQAMPIAGETTYFGGLLFDLGKFGLINGLQLDVAYAHRTDRQYDFDGPAAPDWDEFSTDIIYIHPGEGFFKNLRVRQRFSKTVESGGFTSSSGTTAFAGDRDTYDIRFDVSLNIPFK